jgi:hypothetical protein
VGENVLPPKNRPIKSNWKKQTKKSIGYCFLIVANTMKNLIIGLSPG